MLTITCGFSGDGTGGLLADCVPGLPSQESSVGAAVPYSLATAKNKGYTGNPRVSLRVFNLPYWVAD